MVHLSADLLRKALAQLLHCTATALFRVCYIRLGNIVIDFVNRTWGITDPVESERLLAVTKPDTPVLQMLWGISQLKYCYHAELLWEDFTPQGNDPDLERAREKMSLEALKVIIILGDEGRRYGQLLKEYDQGPLCIRNNFQMHEVVGKMGKEVGTEEQDMMKDAMDKELQDKGQQRDEVPFLADSGSAQPHPKDDVQSSKETKGDEGYDSRYGGHWTTLTFTGAKLSGIKPGFQKAMGGGPANLNQYGNIPREDFSEPENTAANTYDKAYIVTCGEQEFKGRHMNIGRSSNEHRLSSIIEWMMPKILTNKVDLVILRVIKFREIYITTALGGPPRLIKLNAARYLDFGLEELVPSLCVESEGNMDNQCGLWHYSNGGIEEGILFIKTPGRPYCSVEAVRLQIAESQWIVSNGDGDGGQPSSSIVKLINRADMTRTTIARDSDPSQDDVRLCLGNDLKKAQDHKKKGSYGPQFSKSYFEASHIDNSIPRKEKDPGSFTLPCFINSVCFDNALADLGASVSVLPLSTYLNLGLGELAHTKLTSRQDNMPEDIKVPLILERPFLSTAHVKIDVFKRKITLRVGEERIIFKRVKLASSLIKRVYMLSLRERMELDLEARLMGETLVLNRSLDLLNGDYIELNDLNEPLELKRDQVDDLMPTIEEGEVVEEFRTRNDELNSRISDYPSCCDYDKKIRINYVHNLKFSCMIGFEFIHVNFFPILYVNVMSKKFHNSIMKDKLVYKGNNVVGALMNVPIFVGTFFVVTGFAVLEDMDTYRDEGMGDVIFYGPFLKEIGIKARRFDGMITIYNGNDEVSKKDKMNGISHLYQKLKGFYKGVLNLGPDYIRDAKTEEWLTRGHINMHEMEW
ncbi:hypothetical protein Tco_1174604 [Tanacetum coccineum]